MFRLMLCTIKPALATNHTETNTGKQTNVYTQTFHWWPPYHIKTKDGKQVNV